MENKDIIKDIAKALETALNEKNERPNQYIVEYRKVSDNSLIGYHASSFCQLTEDPHHAKRYSGENAYGQLETISNNLKSLLETVEKSEGVFFKIALEIKNEYFKNIFFEDIYLEAVYINDSYPRQIFKLKNPQI